jgi:hypothetical protein
MKSLLFVAFALATMSSAVHAEYSFKVTNNTEEKIVSLEASTDGETWGEFDVGKGIKAGETTKLVWDASTDDSDCEWFFRATFADDSVSEEVAFDFCEKDLHLEFN